MPKDKRITHEKIIACMREEFLTWGYERASLNRIAKRVGITTAALYRHFDGKEDMFGFLVRETIEDFERMQSSCASQMSGDAAQYSPFREAYAAALADFIYEHFEGFKLLLCCSAGSRYACFEEKLIERETQSNQEYARLLERAGVPVRPLTDMQWHLLSTEYVHMVFEMVRHDLPRAQAYRHMEFVRLLLYPGWQRIFGLS